MTNLPGLSAREAKERLHQFGPNEIKETRTFTLLKSLGSQLNNFLMLLLLSAGAIAFFLGERLDSFFIFLVALLNSFFGVYQEFKAEKAIALLKKLAVLKVRVRRDGEEKEVDSRELVPGDILYLEEGAKVPADARLSQSLNLQINEAALTGESFPVEKSENDPENNLIFLGTIIAKGRAWAEVAATGMQTRFGKIAKDLTSLEEPPTPLQRKLKNFAKQIGLLGIMASLTVFLLTFSREKNLFASFTIAVSLAVAAIPEGLPAVMTITLALGVERLARKKAITRKLSAIETLGSVTLVATDKTGTLTTNEMRVRKIWLEGKIFEGKRPPSPSHPAFKALLLNGVLCSTASLVMKIDHGRADVIGDPTEGSLLLLAREAGLEPENVRSKWKIIAERPFNPVTKDMTVVAENIKTGGGGETWIFTKGAPEALLPRCRHLLTSEGKKPLTEAGKNEILLAIQQLGSEGLRLIAFTAQPGSLLEEEKEPAFIGLTGLADPVRPEAAKAVARAAKAGLKTVMITGDNELTAAAIGREIGLIQPGEDILTGKQLENYDDGELLKILPRVKIFARTTPHHKQRLVKLYQKLGETVAVTGDGINDALALKQAEVGVAMGMAGTDVAKETAEIVLSDDNFATLVNAVEEGRQIFQHLKHVVKYLLSCNLGEVIYILLSVLSPLPLLSPLQILYINLVTDGLPAIALAFAPPDRRLMEQPPRRVLTLLERVDYRYIFALGLLTALLTGASFWPWSSADSAVKTTLAFTALIFLQQVILIDLWLSHKPVLRHLSQLGHPGFLAAFAFPLLLHLPLVYLPFFNRVFRTVPLRLEHWLYILTLSLAILFAIEILKKSGFFHPKPHRE